MYTILLSRQLVVLDKKFFKFSPELLSQVGQLPYVGPAVGLLSMAMIRSFRYRLPSSSCSPSISRHFNTHPGRIHEF
jgi:hypothetical protein